MNRPTLGNPDRSGRDPDPRNSLECWQCGTCWKIVDEWYDLDPDGNCWDCADTKAGARLDDWLDDLAFEMYIDTENPSEVVYG